MDRSIPMLLIGLIFGGGMGFVAAAANGITLDGHHHGAHDHGAPIDLPAGSATAAGLPRAVELTVPGRPVAFPAVAEGLPGGTLCAGP
ncbi:hypothetical protein SAMN05421641_10988 [Paracoccus thiocyanatus]|uniref:Uncharacterized protein n=1 Tax=Paracoccus thiocyanatus TaxID=34006 RepID=A0A1N6TN61_9RHOB|nr:hypothetical protein [Paracoccus thiocyanatus]SIQ54773.1 hypothetical protein SAMN05421641_10988 [Paracoccus thiocyanatus]